MLIVEIGYHKLILIRLVFNNSVSYLTNMNDVMDFLELSYYNGKFYGYKHGPLISFPTSSPCSVGYLNTAWPYRSEYNYGDLPSSMTSSDMDNIYNNMPADALDNLLDLSTWGQYNATRYSYYVRG